MVYVTAQHSHGTHPFSALNCAALVSALVDPWRVGPRVRAPRSGPPLPSCGPEFRLPRAPRAGPVFRLSRRVERRAAPALTGPPLLPLRPRASSVFRLCHKAPHASPVFRLSRRNHGRMERSSPLPARCSGCAGPAFVPARLRLRVLKRGYAAREPPILLRPLGRPWGQGSGPSLRRPPILRSNMPPCGRPMAPSGSGKFHLISSHHLPRTASAIGKAMGTGGWAFVTATPKLTVKYASVRAPDCAPRLREIPSHLISALFSESNGRPLKARWCRQTCLEPRPMTPTNRQNQGFDDSSGPDSSGTKNFDISEAKNLSARSISIFYSFRVALIA